MKTKYYLLLALILFFNNFNAQIGIGTTAPDAQLDIRSSNQASPANNDGILVPKVDVFPAINPTAAQQGMLVYLTTSTTFLATTRQPGFYYWNNNPIPDWIGLNSTANGDHDWYEQGTTTPPNAITDNMFHIGNVAVGKNTANYPVDVLSTNVDYGIYNNYNLNAASASERIGFNNVANVNSFGDGIGMKNSVSGGNSGRKIGQYSYISASGIGDQIGNLNFVDNSTIGSSYGVKNLLDGSLGTSGVETFGTHTSIIGNRTTNAYGNYNSITNVTNGLFYGVFNTINSSGTGLKYGVRNELSSNGNQFGVHNLLTGTGAGGQIGNYNEITNTGGSSKTGIFNSITGDSTGDRVAVSNIIFGNTNASTTNGMYNQLFPSGTGIIRGVYNQITAPGLSSYYGSSTELTGNGNGVIYGNHSNISNSGTGIHYGTFNLLSGVGTGQKYGVRNEFTGNGSQFGIYNIFTGSGGTTLFGSYNEISNSNASAHTGVLSTLSGIGAGLKTGISSYIAPTAGGTHYGVYSEVLKAGINNFAGYFLGNVGIGTTAGNTYIMPPSRGTNGQIMQTNATGIVTWQNPGSIAWLTTGNAGTNGGNTTTAGTNFIGTTDNQNIDFRTNNTFRGRFSSLGEFFVGTLNTVLTGDLCNAVGNATFPWAMNGYSDQNGAGTYGQVTAGGTIYAGVQGEYNGTNAQGTGVRGIALTTTAGTGFGAVHTGVSGNATTSGTYKFGVFGSGGTSIRSGGVMGYDYGFGVGALGYYASNTLDYSVYGFGLNYQTGVAAGRLSNALNKKDTNIGLGIYGGIMGGWVRGMKFGFHTKGETYSLYVDGKGYTNKPLAYLINAEEGQNKVASYMSTSIKPEVTVNGKINLENGKVFVSFDKSFSQIISNIDDVIITASPQGKSNGVYIDQISKQGFWIYENNDGTSNTKIAWIAITKIKGEENPEVPNELLASDFDKKMEGVMFNDNNKVDTPQSLWWDGTQIRWDKPTNDKVDTQTQLLARPNEQKE